MKISRVFANANHETFKIKPIKELLNRYIGDGKGWIDPFAGNNSPVEYTNDLNPNTKAKYHLFAQEFIKQFNSIEFDGCILDPPYSPRQMKECYTIVGHKPTMRDTQNVSLYMDVKKAIAPKIKSGGYVITCGWNSYGWGKRFGFTPIELLIVCHSSAHNDTMVLVERKMDTKLGSV